MKNEKLTWFVGWSC